MKKNVLKSSLLLLTVVLLMTSCYHPTTLSNANRGSEVWLVVEIFQGLSSREALAHDSDWNVVKIMSNGEDLLFEGKILRGKYVLVDTYTYYNKDNIRKTVPVFVKKSELSK